MRMPDVDSLFEKIDITKYPVKKFIAIPIIILLIAFFVFGGKKLPEIGAGLGKGLKAFKKGINDVEEEIKSDEDSKSLEGSAQRQTAGTDGAKESSKT